MTNSANNIEQRIKSVEDKFAIFDLISRYGLAADLGDIAMMQGLWVEDCEFLASEYGSFKGYQGLAAVMTGEYQEALLKDGAAHCTSLPRVKIDGDHAIATTFSIICSVSDGGFLIKRLSAIRLEFSYLEDVWKIVKRTSEPIFGDNPAAKKVLSMWNEI